ncbi:NAD-dependent epimerase/dehydratase family protein [Jiella mangrovi]|uniref:NAD-dependent epimerase/dehydratase family protein n=1 Tax=Jiella mangrovi TaxID=2821407 RepID=A0ABS4BL86_9HYPH|nr:NAD-dependent epimerase/dehydratase family protein [Jiella mangrovi]MBP0616956.1 NAD-dependent epimerase/dehydratase family protein [Jiella mangrovi]
MANGRVLVTGASGFIAKHVVLQLLEKGYRVRGTVRSAQKGEKLRQTLASAGGDVSRLELVEADLTRDEGWDEAARDCDFVCHMASPLPIRQPSDKWALLPIAKGGTLRVVQAAAKAGARRLVLTSSVAAVVYGHGAGRVGPFAEDDWSNVNADDISPYAVSKTEAEAAAWDAADKAGLAMVAINPVIVAGPLLDDEPGASVKLVLMMMRGKIPVAPDVSFGVVDVRDVAAAHVAALTADGAPGRRFILSAGSMTLMEMGAAIADAVPDCGKKVPRFTMPNFAVRLAALFLRDLRSLVSDLGRRKEVDTAPARATLGFNPDNPEKAVASTALSLRSHGF